MREQEALLFDMDIERKSHHSTVCVIAEHLEVSGDMSEFYCGVCLLLSVPDEDNVPDISMISRLGWLQC